MDNRVSTFSKRYRRFSEWISDEEVLGRLCNGLLPPTPGTGMVLVSSWGCPVSVPLPCTNPGLFPLCQYTSKLLSCKVTSEVLFNFSVLVLMHAWSRCMLVWFDISCWFISKARRMPSLHVFFLTFLNLGTDSKCQSPPDSDMLCCVRWDWRRPRPSMDLEDVWTRGHNRHRVFGFF